MHRIEKATRQFVLRFFEQSRKLSHEAFIEKNQKSFSIFGNSGKVWVSIFHVRRFEKVELILGGNKADIAIDKGHRQQICASFRTNQSILRSLVWP